MLKKLPYTFLPMHVIAKGSKLFYNLAQKYVIAFPSINIVLKQTDFKVQARDYVALCMFASFSFFLFFGSLLSLFLLAIVGLKGLIAGLLISLIITFFVFLQQMYYPKMISGKRVKDIERNLLPATQNMLIQLNSGIPLFNILINISDGDYGELSKEFGKAVKEINAGNDQVEVLESLAEKNPSLLFRRVIWQIVNGMKAGSDMASVVREAIDTVSEQQLIQIQNYGSQLNPIAMFYMLAAVIVPSLSITFIIILSSFISVSEEGTKMIFWGLFGFVVFIQLMFMGVIRSKRPNLI